METYEYGMLALAGFVFGAAVFNGIYMYRLLTKYPRIPR